MHTLKKILIAVVVVFTMNTGAGAAEKLTLMLDWFPNVDHLPIFLARELGYFERAGIAVDIVTPSDTADALKLAAAGKVDLAVSYQPQVIIAAAGGLEVKVVGRLVAHPLTTLLFLEDSGIRAPRDLTGRKIGYTVPGLMDVLLAAFARLNGIEQYTAVNVGFSIVPSLSSGKVAAVMGPFKTYETVTMARHGYRTGYFELEKNGIPPYDELIFVSGPQAEKHQEKTIIAFSGAVQEGIDAARKDPDESLAVYLRAVPAADPNIESDAFELTLPYYAETQDSDLERWRRFAEFALRYGLIDRPVAVEALLSGKKQ
jgi:putative hydroxymethylpyrimidine transport system substrate-binding protein